MAIWDVYKAFLPVVSRKCFRSSPPHEMTKLTILSKLVVCGMCWHVRKLVHRMRHLIATLFFILSWLSDFWSCCRTEPWRCCIANCASNAAWLALVWTLLHSCALILSRAFFQFVNRVVIHTTLKCCMLLLPNVLQILQKAPSPSSYYSQKNSFSHFLEYFLTDVNTDMLHCFFEDRGPNRSESSLLLLPCLEVNVDVAPKKERISILHKF